MCVTSLEGFGEYWDAENGWTEKRERERSGRGVGGSINTEQQNENERKFKNVRIQNIQWGSLERKEKM